MTANVLTNSVDLPTWDVTDPLEPSALESAAQPVEIVLDRAASDPGLTNPPGAADLVATCREDCHGRGETVPTRASPVSSTTWRQPPGTRLPRLGSLWLRHDRDQDGAGNRPFRHGHCDGEAIARQHRCGP